MRSPRLILPPEVAPLVASARRLPDPPEEARQRLRARLDWAFGESLPAQVIHLHEQRPLHAVPPSAGRRDRVSRWFGSVAGAAATTVFGNIPLALAGLGAALAVAVAVLPARTLWSRVAKGSASTHQAAGSDRLIDPPAGVSPATESPSMPALASPDPGPLADSSPQSSAVRPLRPRLAAPRRSNQPTDDLALAGERLLLEQARLALARGDAIAATASLSEHTARYPRSQLAEERAALSIQALFRSGRIDEARLRGLEFRRQFPNSLLLPALDAALHE